MNFAVVAGGLLPVSAFDLTTPDRPRLEMLVEAIHCCHYSAHDFSRSKGGGPDNFARMNMPIEMGMMYAVCAECGWWDWRENRMGKDEFPILPLAFAE